MKESEFGKGLTYCLGMFLAHSERSTVFGIKEADLSEFMKEQQWNLWFNGASDHLYDLQIPDFLPVGVKKRLKVLQRNSINWGHGCPPKHKPATEKDFRKAIGEAKELLRLIDKNMGVKTLEAEWK